MHESDISGSLSEAGAGVGKWVGGILILLLAARVIVPALESQPCSPSPAWGFVVHPVLSWHLQASLFLPGPWAVLASPFLEAGAQPAEGLSAP